MPSRFFIDQDGIINGIYDGPQDAETMKDGIRQITAFTAQLRKQKKPVLILVDTTGTTTQNAGARSQGAHFFKRADYDKVAIFGGSAMIKYVAKMVLFAVVLASKVQYFDTKEAALVWLKGSSSEKRPG